MEHSLTPVATINNTGTVTFTADGLYIPEGEETQLYVDVLRLDPSKPDHRLAITDPEQDIAMHLTVEDINTLPHLLGAIAAGSTVGISPDIFGANDTVEVIGIELYGALEGQLQFVAILRQCQVQVLEGVLYVALDTVTVSVDLNQSHPLQHLYEQTAAYALNQGRG